MGEQHLDFLAIAAGLLVGRRLGDGTCDIARRLVDMSCDLPARRFRTASRLEWTRAAIGDAREVGDHVVAARSAFSVRPLKDLTGGADITIAPVVVVEVLSAERAVVAFRFVDDWNVRLDPLLVDEEMKVRCGALCGVGREPIGLHAEGRLCPVDHRL
jgi:hypothetical protein